MVRNLSGHFLNFSYKLLLKLTKETFFHVLYSIGFHSVIVLTIKVRPRSVFLEYFGQIKLKLEYRVSLSWISEFAIRKRPHNCITCISASQIDNFQIA